MSSEIVIKAMTTSEGGKKRRELPKNGNGLPLCFVAALLALQKAFPCPETSHCVSFTATGVIVWSAFADGCVWRILQCA